MKPLRLFLDSIVVAAVMIALAGWFDTSGPFESLGEVVLFLLLMAVTAEAINRLVSRTRDAHRRREAAGAEAWWGVDAAVREIATPIALGGCLALVIWGLTRSTVDAKLGGAGSLMVLAVVVAVGAKLAAETYLFAQLGGDASPRQRSAELLIGRYSLASKARYFLGGLGGVILPLGAQILASGSKHIPAVMDAGPPAMLACASLVCLVPGELIERSLFWRAVGDPDQGMPESA